MKVLHISALPVWPIAGKGGMPSLRETLQGHVAGGHEVVLALPRYQLFDDLLTPIAVQRDEGYQVHVVACRWAPLFFAIRRLARRISGGKEPIYPFRWSLNLTLCVLLTLSLVLAALRIRRIENRQFDLVYAHNQYSACAGWFIGRMFRIPNVTRLYGTFLADLARRPFVRLRYPVAAAGFLVPHSLLICGNDGTRGDEVARKLRIDMSRFRFWQNGVDLPTARVDSTRAEVAATFPKSELRLESKWVLSCSRLSYWKRIDRIVRALQVARNRGCDCQLLLAGAGPEKENLRTLAEELGVASQVVWLGAVDHDFIWRLMHVADAFAITNDVTNRCNPLYEAICARTPVVSIHDPSTADLLKHGENALLSDKDDFLALGEHLHRLLTDENLHLLMRQAQAERQGDLWSWRERMEVEVGELEALVAETECRSVPPQLAPSSNGT